MHAFPTIITRGDFMRAFRTMKQLQQFDVLFSICREFLLEGFLVERGNNLVSWHLLTLLKPLSDLRG